MKKILSALLITCIIISTLCITGNAYYDVQLFEGETVTVSRFDENAGYFQRFFIPEETGYYRFYSTGWYSTFCSIMDSNFETIAGSRYEKGKNFSVDCYMVAGETYYLSSSVYWDVVGINEYSVCIEKTEITFADDIFIYHGGNTTVYVGDNVYYECFTEDEDDYFGTCTWEITPFWMADVTESYINTCRLFFVDEGTFTLTVTTSTGLTDSVEITCIKPPSVETDEMVNVSFGCNGGVRKFRFTPDDYGYYALCTVGNVDATVTIHEPRNTELRLSYSYDENGQLVQKGWMDPLAVYDIEISCDGEHPDFEFYITECPPAESMSISADGLLYGYVGERLYFHQLFYPAISMGESVVWYTSDESVAERGYDENRCGVDLKKVGTAVITCESESGFTACVTVECRETESISLGETRTVHGSEKKVFSFIPPKDGYYTFSSEGCEDGLGNFLDKWWYCIDVRQISFDGNNFRRFAYLEKGTEYFLCTSDFGLASDETFEVSVNNAPFAKNLTFEKGEEIYAYVGETVILPFYFDREDVFFENVDAYSSDDDLKDITAYSTYFKVKCLKEGTTSILALSERNLRASCNIHILPIEYTEIYEGDALEIEMGDFEYEYFSFTAPKDGKFVLWTEGSSDTYVEHINEYLLEIDYDDDSSAGDNFSLSIDANEGEVYRFRVAATSKGDKFTLKLAEGTQAAQMSIFDDSVIYADVGDSFFVTASFTPGGAVCENVSFRTDDRGVFIVENYDGESYCLVYVKGEGVATLSAYSDSGLYSEVTVVAGDCGMTGDVNGDGAVNAVDANLLARYLSGQVINMVEANADLDADGKINAKDSYLLKRILSGQ